tara:strand:- start:1627 stop:2319 length:693 start_codon:yes stop_codon:yes gene_type:complete
MSGRVGSITTDIIADGLVFNMDAANRASYPKTGTTATDTVGNKTGTISGAVFVSDGQGGFDFDGSDDVITTNLVYSLSSATTEFSCGCWFKAGTQTSGKLLVSNYNFTPIPFNLYLKSDGTCQGTSRNSSYTTISVGSGDTYDDNEYHNFYYQRDSNNIYYTYVDGILKNTGTATLGAIATTNAIRIGKLGQYTQGYFDGIINTVQIYNRALSSNEVLHNYNALKGRFGL